MTKRKPLGAPLQADDAELDRLSATTEADIDAAIAHWLRNAPERAKGLLLAREVDLLSVDNAEATAAA